MRILVATDGSRGSAAALRFAARFASADPATELILICVERNGRRPTHELPRPGKALPARVVAEKRAKKILEDAARELEKRGVHARTRLVPARPPRAVPEAICREADSFRADLVVVGSEGRDTLSEWVVGGVALRLIYLSHRPVTVVRPPRRRNAS